MTEPIIKVTNLRKLFATKKRSLFDREDRFVHAVDDVSFTVAQGEVLALVGESGCGKSTLALTLMGLEPPTAGFINIAGQEVGQLDGRGLKKMRRDIQMIFQDPYESLNPMMTIGDIVAEPLQVHGIGRSKTERLERAAQALEDAGPKASQQLYAPAAP